MQCKNLILVVGVLVFLHGSDALFNTGGKHESSKAVVKSSANMSKSFEVISKSLDKSIASMETVSFITQDNEIKKMITYKLAIQAYKSLFDAFGKAFGGTNSQPGPLELMAGIQAQITALVDYSRRLIDTLTGIDGLFKTTLGTIAPTGDAQTTFSGILDALFKALKTLIPFNQVTDEQLATAIKNVDMAGLLKYLANYEVTAANMANQTKYIETQAKALEDYYITAKKVLEPFTKDLAKFTKATRDNIDKGKILKDGLDKEYSDQKTKAAKVQEALKKNAELAQTTAAASASSKVNDFFATFAEAVSNAKSIITRKLSSQYDFSSSIEVQLTNTEVLILKSQLRDVANAFFENKDGSGQKCLKKMTPDFTAMFKAYVTSQYACFEDYTTYVSFTSEFVKIKMAVLKCLGETAVNYLPACVKQISKKTSSTYANTLYTGCLTTFSGLLDYGFEAGIGGIITDIYKQVESDLEFLQKTYLACTLSADTVRKTDIRALLLTFTACSPAPIVL